MVAVLGMDRTRGLFRAVEEKSCEKKHLDQQVKVLSLPSLGKATGSDVTWSWSHCVCESQLQAAGSFPPGPHLAHGRAFTKHSLDFTA